MLGMIYGGAAVFRVVLLLFLLVPAWAALGAVVNGPILFQTGRHIYCVNPDGSGLTRITYVPGLMLTQSNDPSVLAEGNQLAWLRYLPGNSQVMVINSNVVLLIDDDGKMKYTFFRSRRGINWNAALDVSFLVNEAKKFNLHVGDEQYSLQISDTGYAIFSTPDPHCYLLAKDGTEQLFQAHLPDGTVTPLYEGTAPTFSPDGRRMAFLRKRDIFLANADGSGSRQITRNASVLAMTLAFSPDGAQLLYAHDTVYGAGGAPDVPAGLCSINLEGNDRQEIPLAFLGELRRSITCVYWGTDFASPSLPAPRLATPADQSSDLTSPITLAWQPVDGARSYTLQVSTSPFFPPREHLKFIDVTSTRQLITDFQENTPHYWRVKAEATDKESRWSAVFSFSARWAPVISMGSIVFCSTRTGYSQLFLVHPDGSGLRQLTFDNTSKASPRFSPDGRMIVFTSDNGLECLQADGSGRKLLSDTRGTRSPPYRPVFSADGTQIIYTARVDEFPGDYSDVLQCDLTGKVLYLDGTVWDPYVGDVDESQYYLHEGRLPPLYLGPYYHSDRINKWLEDILRGPTGRIPVQYAYNRLFIAPSWSMTTKEEVVVMDAEGKHLRTYTAPGSPADSASRISPDGRFLLLTRVIPDREMKEQSELFLLSTNGTLCRPLAPSIYQEFDADWGPL